MRTITPELSRRDDIEALAITLLYLLHERLPWQGIYAPDVKAKMRRIGEMKAGAAFQQFLSQSPPEFGAVIEHARSLAFEDKPDYNLIRELFMRRMQNERWENDGLFDWIDSKFLDRGTLIQEEYAWVEEVAADSSKDADAVLKFSLWRYR